MSNWKKKDQVQNNYENSGDLCHTPSIAILWKLNNPNYCLMEAVRQDRVLWISTKKSEDHSYLPSDLGSWKGIIFLGAKRFDSATVPAEIARGDLQ